MTPQLRNFYKLEKRWKDAEIYDYSSFLAELSRVKPQNIVDGEETTTLEEDDWAAGDVVENTEEQDDPFWK